MEIMLTFKCDMFIYSHSLRGSTVLPPTP